MSFTPFTPPSAPPSGAAGGDLSGTYPNPTVAAIGGVPATLPLSVANGGTGLTVAPAAPAGFAPADPASTASTSLVMMGLGATCKYTPAGSGKVLVTITGQAQTLTAAAAVQVGLRFGTGAAPAFGAAVSGTRLGGADDPLLKAGGPSESSTFTSTALLTLAPGTTYWFDVAALTQTAADQAQITSVAMTMAEH